MHKLALGGALLLAAASTSAQPSIPAGSQFQINSYTTGDQVRAAVAMTPRRRFIVVWRSDGSGHIEGQRFASDASPLGSQFQVDSHTPSGQEGAPDVAVAPDGSFIVVWRSNASPGNDDSFTSIQGQRFASEGNPLGLQFQVNSYTTYGQRHAAVTVDSEGDFVVAWTSDGSAGDDNSQDSVQGQRFAADGSTLDSEFQVNSYTTNNQQGPALASDSEGNFVVVWHSDGSPGSDPGYSIQGQRFASEGSTIGSQFQVNSYTRNYQKWPGVAMTPNGEFMVVWVSNGSSGSDTWDTSIQGQLYSFDGNALGSQLQVNSFTSRVQYAANVTADAEDEFVVVWTSRGSPGSDTSRMSVQGQRFASDGSALGAQFQVNSFTMDFQGFSTVDATSEGDFVVAWHSDGSPGSDMSGYSIQGQLFLVPLFADGFETGDTIAWSATVDGSP